MVLLDGLISSQNVVRIGPGQTFLSEWNEQEFESINQFEFPARSTQTKKSGQALF